MDIVINLLLSYYYLHHHKAQSGSCHSYFSKFFLSKHNAIQEF